MVSDFEALQIRVAAATAIALLLPMTRFRAIATRAERREFILRPAP